MDSAESKHNYDFQNMIFNAMRFTYDIIFNKNLSVPMTKRLKSYRCLNN